MVSNRAPPGRETPVQRRVNADGMALSHNGLGAPRAERVPRLGSPADRNGAAATADRCAASANRACRNSSHAWWWSPARGDEHHEPVAAGASGARQTVLPAMTYRHRS